MASKATIVLVGHLGRDPELKYTNSNKAVCTMSVPTDSGYGDKKKTTWWRVTCWEKQAEACGKNLRKGSLVQVVGEPFEREWTDKDGVVRKSMEVQARDVTFLSGGGQNGSRAESAEAPGEKRNSKGWDDDGAKEGNDDIPF